MAVLPGSLDYLYHYGILNYIPTEAYDYSYLSYKKHNQRSYYDTMVSNGMTKDSFMSQPQINQQNNYAKNQSYQDSDTFESINPARQFDAYNNKNYNVNEHGDSFTQNALGIKSEELKSDFNKKNNYTKGIVSLAILSGLLILDGIKCKKIFSKMFSKK